MAFSVALLALFEGTPRVFVPLAFGVFGIICAVGYSRDILRRRRQQVYLDRIEPVMTFTLRIADKVLRKGSGTSLQISVMLAKECWIPRYNFNLGPGKKAVYIPRGSAWMAYVEKGGTKVLLLIDDIKELLPDKENIQCFCDVSAVVVSPIYSPKGQKSLIGALVAYSEEGDTSVLMRDKDRCEEEAKKVAAYIANILCYQHICEDH
jgi:hypothetical protein